MSTLSKVFVVLVLLASVVFAMTSVARLKTTEDYRQKYLDEQKARKAAEEDARTARAQREEALKKFEAERAQLTSQINLKDAEIASLKAGKKTAEEELQNLKTTLEKVVNDLASVKDELKQAREANERLRKEKDEAVKRSAEDTEARLDAEQRLKESQLQVKNLRTDLKNKEEQIARLLAQATKYDQMLTAFEKRFNITREDVVSVTGPVATKRVSGLVTEVRREGEEVYVLLSVGSTSDVKVGTQFIIYGEGVYKGDMVVTKVYPDSSFGRLTARGLKDPVKGDRATTKLQTGT